MNYLKLSLVALTTALLFSCADDDETNEVVTIPETSKTEVALSTMLETPAITTLNPSGVAPLTAELKLETKLASNVEITVLGSIPVNKKFNTASTLQELNILGLYPGITNRVAVRVETEQNFALDTLEITTDSLPSVLPSIEINMAQPALMEAGMNFNNLSITDGTNFQPYPLAYDHEGNVRWFLNLENIFPGFVSPMERLSNGNLLCETGKTIVQIDMMGRIQKQTLLPTGYSSHHDVILLPNGNYLVAVDKVSNQISVNGTTVSTLEDVMIEISGTTGALIEEWNFADILDVDRGDYIALPTPLTATVDWFHMNAVYYSEIDDSFIISGRNQGLVKVGRNNNLNWIMAPHRGWGKAGASGNGAATAPFLLTAVNASGSAYDSLIQDGSDKASDFDWVWGQHAPMTLPNGNLLVFDNGFNRNFSGNDEYSRAVEYKVNEQNKTIEQVWSYGESRGVETLSTIISDVDYLPNTGNVLFCPGIRFGENYSKIIEVSRPGGQVIFEGTMDFTNERSVTSGFGRFDLTYRAERMTLYP